MSVSIDIAVEADNWNDVPAEAIVRKAIQATLSEMGEADCEVGVVLSDDAHVRVLNRTWRGKDSPTNVLSFPAADPAQEGPRLLGDVVVAFETTAREAEAEGKTLESHLTHLTVHGVLHLLGHDHERDDDAEAMEDRERKILARLGISDPYDAAPLQRTETV